MSKLINDLLLSITTNPDSDYIGWQAKDIYIGVGTSTIILTNRSKNSNIIAYSSDSSEKNTAHVIEDFKPANTFISELIKLIEGLKEKDNG